jgi:hypothetical protein
VETCDGALTGLWCAPGAPPAASCDGPNGVTDGRNAMRKPEQDREALAALNHHYVRSVDEADTEWFEANLAVDFFNTNPDGSLIGRAAFIAQIARGSGVRNIREHDAVIRLFGDFAIIHARTTYHRLDGSEGGGRYTDDWLFREGRWRCISAHVTRL